MIIPDYQLHSLHTQGYAHGVFVSSAWLVGESWAKRWQEVV